MCSMGTSDNVNTSEKSHKSKPSKRKRQSIKQKTVKSRLHKTKKKVTTKRKKSTDKKPAVSTPAKPKEEVKDKLNGMSKLKRKKDTTDKDSILKRKRLTNTILKPTTDDKTTESTSKLTTSNRRKKFVAKKVPHNNVPPAVDETAEPDKEPDKNWKELAKRLGIAEKKKTKQSADSSKIEDKVPKNVDSRSEMWFDDVEDIFIERPEDPESTSVTAPKEECDDISSKLIKPGTTAKLTKCLAMDCEMVGIGPGGEESALARISVVNQHGHCVYDQFVKAKEKVTDYRTWVSGVRPEDLEDASDLETVQKEVNEMFKDRMLVGHAISNDEKVLFMNHPKKYVRDTQKYPGFRKLVGGRKPGLKLLTQKVLGVKIQSGEHSSVQDAQATMRLYTMIREKWEKDIKEKHRLNKHIKEKGLKASKSKSAKHKVDEA